MKKIGISQIIIVILITVITMIVSNIAIADTVSKTENSNTSTNYRTDVKIINVMPAASRSSKEVNYISLGDLVNVYVRDYDDAISESENKEQKIILFINGMPLKGIVPIGVEPTASKSITKLTFKIERTEDTKKVWNIVLGKPDWSMKKEVSFSIGLENGQPVRISDKSKKEQTILTLQLMSKNGLFLWGVVVIAIILLFFLLIELSPILKNNGKDSPYSLGKTQMMIWTMVVIPSYIFIYQITNDPNILTVQVLALMGISAATGVGAIMIGDAKQNKIQNIQNQIQESKNDSSDNTKEKIEELTAAINTNKEEIKNLEADLSEESRGIKNQIQKLEKDIITKEEKIKKLKDKLQAGVHRWIDDILTDSDGYSLHRVQMFLWTFILVGIFIGDVYSSMSMPEFSDLLLATMGISSLTYLGFKFPEK